MPTPTLLHVEAAGSRELVATAARLDVTVSGSGGWFTPAAVARSAEVRQLTAALTKAGVPEEAVALRGVTMHDEAGVFGRNTRASYSLRISVEALDRLGEVLTVLSEQKNTSLDRVGWRFEEEEGRLALVADLVKAASRRAATMAAALGLEVVGIRSISDTPANANGVSLHYEAGAPQGSFSKARASASPALTTLGTCTLQMTVVLEAEARHAGGSETWKEGG